VSGRPHRARSARTVALLVVLALLALPGAAEACSVCFSATEENRMAFLVTTGLLTALPLAILGGIGLWLRRRLREMEHDHEAARHAPQRERVSPPR